jgi:hypothetical protein
MTYVSHPGLATIGLWTDQRIGEQPVHRDSRDLMQLPDEVRKLVCFIYGSGGGQDWTGTGFFVFDPLGVSDATGNALHAIYIVTARHCVQQVDPNRDAPVESIQIRLNTRDGGSRMIATDVDRWIHHPIADVSVYSIAPSEDQFDYLYYPIREQAGPFYLVGDRSEPVSIGPGAEVFLTGLLYYHPGQSRIMPIIRVGNIAAFPEEPVTLRTGADQVILIESRSLGGLSGSPVFVHFPPWRYDGDWNIASFRPPSVPGLAGPNYLLGIVHGYYPTMGNDPDGLGNATSEPLNTGISVVVPIERAIDLIDGPELSAEREALKDYLRASTMPRMTTASVAPEFDNFRHLTRKLLSVSKKDPDQERSTGVQPGTS